MYGYTPGKDGYRKRLATVNFATEKASVSFPATVTPEDPIAVAEQADTARRCPPRAGAAGVEPVGLWPIAPLLRGQWATAPEPGEPQPQNRGTGGRAGAPRSGPAGPAGPASHGSSASHGDNAPVGGGVPAGGVPVGGVSAGAVNRGQGTLSGTGFEAPPGALPAPSGGQSGPYPAKKGRRYFDRDNERLPITRSQRLGAGIVTVVHRPYHRSVSHGGRCAPGVLHAFTGGLKMAYGQDCRKPGRHAERGYGRRALI